MSAGRRSRVPMVLGCLLGFAVLCLAAASGASAAFIVPGRDLPAPEEENTMPDQGPGTSAWDFWTSAGEPRVMERWFAVVLGVVITLLIAVAVVLLVRSVVIANTRRRERLEDRPETVRTWNRVQAAVVVEEATERALAQLHEGQAGDALIAYWQAVQAAGADAGLPREVWETSSEYAARLVTELGVTAQAITVVVDLFREVRFSSHRLDSESEDLARSALSLIRSDLGDVAPVRAEST